MPGEKGGIGLPGLPVCFCVPIKINNQKRITVLATVSSNHSYHLLIFKYLRYYWSITASGALQQILKHPNKCIMK